MSEEENHDFTKFYPDVLGLNLHELIRDIEYLTEEQLTERKKELSRRLKEHESFFDEQGIYKHVRHCEKCNRLEHSGTVTYQRCNICKSKFGKRGHKAGCNKNE